MREKDAWTHPAKAHGVPFRLTEKLICKGALAQKDHESGGDCFTPTAGAKAVVPNIAHARQGRSHSQDKPASNPRALLYCGTLEEGYMFPNLGRRAKVDALQSALAGILHNSGRSNKYPIASMLEIW